MAYRKLLVPVIGTEAGEAALATAFMAARIWQAHVHGLHVRIDPRDVAPLAGEGLSGAMIEEMMSATERESSERAKGVQAMFARYIASRSRHACPTWWSSPIPRRETTSRRPTPCTPFCSTVAGR